MDGESRKRICEEEGAEDRISNLPLNVLDHILDCVPIRDAARASSLSRQWKNIWTLYPHLVFDKKFTEDIKKNRNLLQFQVDYVNIVYRILLQHEGDIKKFVLNFPEIPSFLHGQQSYTDNWKIYSNIDHWMLFLAKKGVTKLTLVNSNSAPYRLPSYVFSFQELTTLDISKFSFGAPKSSKGFSKLTSLILKEVTFNSSFLAIPQLKYLGITNCRGTRFLDVSAALLKRLRLCDNDDFELSSYVTCKNLKGVYIALSDAVRHNKLEGDVSLTTVLNCWPVLSNAYFNGNILKYLTAGLVSGKRPAIVNSLNYLCLFRMKYDSNEIASILYLLQSASNLQKLEIWTSQTYNHIELVPNLEEPGFHLSTYKLETVKMKHFKGSKAEILLVKILLAVSPSLGKMHIKQSRVVSSLDTLKELIQLPRASPKAQIFYE